MFWSTKNCNQDKGHHASLNAVHFDISDGLISSNFRAKREWLVMVVAVALKCIGPEITDRFKPNFGTHPESRANRKRFNFLFADRSRTISQATRLL
jgi:hypothetical protein